MMQLFFFVLVVMVFLAGLLLVGFVMQMGGNMDERRVMVFEVYRYAVCFVMVMAFAAMAGILLISFFTDMNNTQALAGPAVGIILTILIFAVHWNLKNPVLKSVKEDAA